MILNLTIDGLGLGCGPGVTSSKLSLLPACPLILARPSPPRHLLAHNLPLPRALTSPKQHVLARSLVAELLLLEDLRGAIAQQPERQFTSGLLCVKAKE